MASEYFRSAAYAPPKMSSFKPIIGSEASASFAVQSSEKKKKKKKKSYKIYLSFNF